MGCFFCVCVCGFMFFFGGNRNIFQEISFLGKHRQISTREAGWFPSCFLPVPVTKDALRQGTMAGHAGSCTGWVPPPQPLITMRTFPSLSTQRSICFIGLSTAKKGQQAEPDLRLLLSQLLQKSDPGSKFVPAEYSQKPTDEDNLFIFF